MDTISGIERLHGNEKLYYNMLHRLETLTLSQSLAKIATAYDKKDREELQEFICSIKSAFRYIGAGRLYFICNCIE